MTMNKTKLLKLADFLDKVPAKAFNLDTWVDLKKHDEDGEPTMAYGKDATEVLKNILEKNPEYNCGTTACAVGWMPFVFPEEVKHERWGGVVFNDDFLQGTGEGAARFFNISVKRMNYLFMPTSYPHNKRKAKDVANRIRSCVKNGFPENFRSYTK